MRVSENIDNFRMKGSEIYDMSWMSLCQYSGYERREYNHLKAITEMP